MFETNRAATGGPSRFQTSFSENAANVVVLNTWFNYRLARERRCLCSFDMISSQWDWLDETLIYHFFFVAPGFP